MLHAIGQLGLTTKTLCSVNHTVSGVQSRALNGEGIAVDKFRLLCLVPRSLPWFRHTCQDFSFRPHTQHQRRYSICFSNGRMVSTPSEIATEGIAKHVPFFAASQSLRSPKAHCVVMRYQTIRLPDDSATCTDFHSTLVSQCESVRLLPASFPRIMQFLNIRSHEEILH